MKKQIKFLNLNEVHQKNERGHLSILNRLFMFENEETCPCSLNFLFLSVYNQEYRVKLRWKLSWSIGKLHLANAHA